MDIEFKISQKPVNYGKAINFLESKGVEARPLIAGNLSRHPAGKIMGLETSTDSLPGADFHHEKSFYVGLSPIHSLNDITRT